MGIMEKYSQTREPVDDAWAHATYPADCASLVLTQRRHAPSKFLQNFTATVEPTAEDSDPEVSEMESEEVNTFC